MFERKVDPNRKTIQAVEEMQQAKIIGEEKMRDGKVTKSRIFSSSSFAVLGFATSEETCKPEQVITNVRVRCKKKKEKKLTSVSFMYVCVTGNGEMLVFSLSFFPPTIV